MRRLIACFFLHLEEGLVLVARALDPLLTTAAHEARLPAGMRNLYP